MTASEFATAAAWSYGAAALGYLAFAIRVAFGSLKNPRARLLIAALLVTAVWATACVIFAATGSVSAMRASVIADACRYAAWFAFVGYLMASDGIFSSR